MASIDHSNEVKQKADQLDAQGVHKDTEILKKDMRSAAEVMYQDKGASVLPEHLRNEFPQQSGGITTGSQKPQKELITKASKMSEPHAGPVYNGWERGQVETTDKWLAPSGFHGTANINEPTNLLVKDYLVTANNNSYHPQQTADKPKDRSLIHSDEADRRAMGLGKNDLTDRPDPNQLQTSTHTLTSAEPLHNQAGNEMVKDRPLGAEETKESLGPYLKSTPAQREYTTMASKKGEDATLGQKLMDTAAHGWNEAKSWFGGGKKEEAADESGEKRADKGSDNWEGGKDKAAEAKAAVKADEQKPSIGDKIKELGPTSVTQGKSIDDNQNKASDNWESTKDKAEEAKEWAAEKGEEGKQTSKAEGLDTAEKPKKTVTYSSDNKDEAAEKLWKKSHKRDDKLYENLPDKTTFEEVYEQAYEKSELKAMEAKDLLEEPHERASQLDSKDLHNPIERTDEKKNKEEVMQENAETASELLAPHTKADDLKDSATKKSEKPGSYESDFGLQDKKPSNTQEKRSPESLSQKQQEA